MIRMLILVAAALAAGAAAAQGTGDPTHGLALARETCSTCHLVGSEQRPAEPLPGPSFRDIAGRPGLNQGALLAWLQTPHPMMPRLVVRPEDARDLIAYIVSLRQR